MEDESAYDVDLSHYPNKVGSSEQHLSAADSKGMDTEDGGVSLHSSTLTTSDHFDSQYIIQIKTLYHQASKADLEKFGCAWSVPAAPLPVKNTQLKHSQDHPLIKTYTKHLNLIMRHWNCQANECLPDLVRRETPYSLAMVCSLRALASSMKHNIALAHSLLLRARRQRILTSGPPSVPLVETFLASDRPIEMGETTIWENPLGLMHCDVLEATKHAQTSRRQEGRQQKGTGRITKLLKMLPKEEQQNIARDLGQGENSPLSTTKMRQRRKALMAVLVKDQSVAGLDLSNVLSNKDRQTSVQKPQHPDGGEIQLTDVLNDIHFNSQKRMRKRRAERLEAGGFSREIHGKTAMPSEKMDMAALPSLETMTPTTDDATLSRLGQLRLSNTPTFEASLQLRPK